MRLIREALGSYLTTRRLSALSRTDFETAQAQALRHWLDHDLPQVPAFARAPRDLALLPVMDKAALMADFASYNRAGITADQVRAALASECKVGPFTVGASTGTSGNRGYFVISDLERYRWLGALLAKAMAGLLWRPQRVAIILPQDTRLYSSARSVPFLQLRFFALTQGVEAWRDTLAAYDPTVIVAPPKVLRHFVEHGPRLAPRRIFSAAETLDPVDRHVIEDGFGLMLGQIYMATEGLLGVTCAHGHLHLAEDSVAFAFEPVGDGLVSPLITSFRRQEQILARYRMNDLLRLSNEPCPCGSPLQRVEEVVGRIDDCFRFGAVLVTPDVLRNAVVQADARITDFRVIQTADGAVTLVLPHSLAPDAVGAAQAGVQAALARLGVQPVITVTRDGLALDVSRKLRRVECRLGAGA
ncbi:MULTISPECIES: CoF synthetase [unclassified Yoonia]|uniref:CoF synthetase n=1 Tax=unclassified Yoonia TaxID=2629118 RepID=UPI002AFE9997|nr:MULTISPECIES: CoF synthetase [unclassified Yoonia]